MSELAKLVQEVNLHLEFQGYECEVAGDRNDIIIAIHPQKSNIVAYVYSNGVTLRVNYSSGAKSKTHECGYLESLNRVNRNLIVSTVYSDQDCDFIIRAVLPVPYSRSVFARFLEVFDDDCDKIKGDDELVEYLT